jgi:hypothetical protein
MHSVSLKSFKLVRLLPDSNRKDFRALHFIHFFYAFFLRRNVSDFVGINDPGSWLLVPGSSFSTFSLFLAPGSWLLVPGSFPFPPFHSFTLSLFLVPGSINLNIRKSFLLLLIYRMGRFRIRRFLFLQSSALYRISTGCMAFLPVPSLIW